MDESDSEQGQSTSTPPKKRCMKRIQKYRKEWESTFKWVCGDKDSKTKAYCKVCSSSLKSEIQVLKLHENSAKHKQLLKSTKYQASLLGFVKPKSELPEGKAVRAELKLAGFFAEHNIPFSLIDHLTQLQKDIFPDSEIAKGLRLGRTKLTVMIKNVIGQEHKLELAKKIKTCKFSILTDESTDISSEKCSCIVVRYFDEETGNILSKFWELVQVYSKNVEDRKGATAEHLFSSIVNSFMEYGVPLENVVGFASDGTNVMMGQHNSVASRFIQQYPGIVIMKCICHSAHLCASESCKNLPKKCEDLARNIYTHFKNSSKRQHDFQQFQMFTNVDIHKILHPSQTRWLSLNEVVNRIIEQWQALRLYFSSTYLTDRLVATEMIYQDLNDPFMKLYYYFLGWILPKFTNFNSYFQSEHVVISNLNHEIITLYQDILLCYMERNYVFKTKVELIDPGNETTFISIKNMYLGVHVMNLLEDETVKRHPDLITHFFTRCRLFMITACQQIKMRFNFNDPLLKNLNFFIPSNALSNNFRNNNPSLFPIFQYSKRFLPSNSVDIQQLIDDEWRKLPFIRHQEIRNEEKIDIFWSRLLHYKNALDISEFTNLAKFALNLLSIPHSNAQCERIFSKVNLIKTKQRNRLITDTVNGSLLSSQCIKENNGTCITFEPSKQMYLGCNQSMYQHVKKMAEDTNISDEDDVLELNFA